MMPAVSIEIDKQVSLGIAKIEYVASSVSKSLQAVC